jgi:hypothetical protein
MTLPSPREVAFIAIDNEIERFRSRIRQIERNGETLTLLEMKRKLDDIAVAVTRLEHILAYEAKENA